MTNIELNSRFIGIRSVVIPTRIFLIEWSKETRLYRDVYYNTLYNGEYQLQSALNQSWGINKLQDDEWEIIYETDFFTEHCDSSSLYIIRNNENEIFVTEKNGTKINNEEFKKDSIENFINRKIRKLEFGLNTVKIIASIAPLLGLLGTVIGVLDSYEPLLESEIIAPS